MLSKILTTSISLTVKLLCLLQTVLRVCNLNVFSATMLCMYIKSGDRTKCVRYTFQEERIIKCIQMTLIANVMLSENELDSTLVHSDRSLEGAGHDASNISKQRDVEYSSPELLVSGMIYIYIYIYIKLYCWIVHFNWHYPDAYNLFSISEATFTEMQRERSRQSKGGACKETSNQGNGKS